MCSCWAPAWRWFNISCNVAVGKQNTCTETVACWAPDTKWMQATEGQCVLHLHRSSPITHTLETEDLSASCLHWLPDSGSLLTVHCCCCSFTGTILILIFSEAVNGFFNWRASHRRFSSFISYFCLNIKLLTINESLHCCEHLGSSYFVVTPKAEETPVSHRYA